MIKKIKYILLLFAFIVHLDFHGQESNISYSAKSTLTEPTLFAEDIISTPDRETGCSFAPDGNRLFFAKWSLDFKIAVLCYSDFIDGIWKEPVILPFSGIYHDQHPFVTYDGKELYFISSRPHEGKRSGFRIWKVKLNGNSFGTPEILDETINKPGFSNYSPSLTLDGALYYCQKKAREGTADVFYAERKDDEYFPQKIENDSINSSDYNEWHSYISPNGKVLIFTSDGKPDGFGKEDLYVAYKEGNKWIKIKNLGNKINTSDHEYLASFSPDKKYLFFSSVRYKTYIPPKDSLLMTDYEDFVRRIRSAENGQPNLYQIDVNETDLIQKYINEN